MARNKYPEVTVEKILEAAQRLFLEKGYDGTTIQDIVQALGGLTKGAIYHHFKSKEEIMDALGEKMFFDNNPFEAVKCRKDLSGLQKMREVIRINHADTARTELSLHSIPLLQNPQILARMIDTDRRLISPLWLALLEEGQRDGSIQTDCAGEIAELLPLLTNLWLVPSVYAASAKEIMKKFACVDVMLRAMGLPLIDEEIKKTAAQHFKRIAAAAAPD